MKTAAVIALFCAGGGLARYYLSGWIYSRFGRSFPYGTLAVNIIGAYFIGLIMELGLSGHPFGATLQLGLTIGLMGGLTTFSTFSYETCRLLEDGQYLVGLLNALASVLLCLLFTWLGIASVRALA